MKCLKYTIRSWTSIKFPSLINLTSRLIQIPLNIKSNKKQKNLSLNFKRKWRFFPNFIHSCNLTYKVLYLLLSQETRKTFKTVMTSVFQHLYSLDLITHQLCLSKTNLKWITYCQYRSPSRHCRSCPVGALAETCPWRQPNSNPWPLRSGLLLLLESDCKLENRWWTTEHRLLSSPQNMPCFLIEPSN